VTASSADGASSVVTVPPLDPGPVCTESPRPASTTAAATTRASTAAATSTTLRRLGQRSAVDGVEIDVDVPSGARAASACNARATGSSSATLIRS
jgi:hypothetical protein